jgi:hypothetical protein
MTMNTRILLALILSSVSMLPLRVAANPSHDDQPPPPKNLYRSLEAGSPSRPAGTLHGSIESIDYASGTLILRSGNHSQLVSIVPSTTIYGGGGGGYTGLSDLRRGQNVSISVYEIDGRLVAQSIRVK